MAVSQVEVARGRQGDPPIKVESCSEKQLNTGRIGYGRVHDQRALRIK